MNERTGALCEAGVRGAPERALVLACTLYCLAAMSLPSAYGASVAGLVALVGALRGGMWRVFYVRYRAGLWTLIALVAINAIFARFPAKVAPGVGELLRSVLMMLPAMYVVQYCSRQEALIALKAMVALVAVGCFSIYVLHAGSPDVMNAIYDWSFAQIGNVHNLVNVATMAVLALVVLLAFERNAGLRAGLVVVLGTMVWFLVLLESEGTYLALLLTACAWGALRLTGLWRAMALLGILAGLLGYVLLMMRPDAGHAAQGVNLGGFEVRSMINARLLELVAERPWFGHGINSFKYVTEAAVNGVAYIHPHQIYLEALFSLGIVGCVVLGAALVGFFRFSCRLAMLREPLPMLGFLVVAYMAGKGLTDMKFVSVQPLGAVLLGAGLMARPASRGGAGELP